MKNGKLILVSAIAAVTCATPAFATSRVTVNGETYECTTRCNVEFNGGGAIITDCCGGTAEVVIENPPIDE